MRFLTALALIAFCITATPAGAADVFVKKKEAEPAAPQAPLTAPAPAEPQTATEEPAPQPVPQKAAPKSTAPYVAQKKQAAQGTAITQDKATNFYNNCKSQQKPLYDTQSYDDFCACTATTMMDTMVAETISLAATNTPEGQHARNAITMKVYAPCMHYSIKALLKGNCINNQGLKMGLKNHGNVCECMSADMALYMKEHAPTILGQSLQSNPGTMDPLGPLVNSGDFDTRSQQSLMSCLQRYEYGAQ